MRIKKWWIIILKTFEEKTCFFFTLSFPLSVLVSFWAIQLILFFIFISILISFSHLAVDRPFLYRLSIAAVSTSGPFSIFSGYTRAILLLEGRGMVLTVNKSAGNHDNNSIENLYDIGKGSSWYEITFNKNREGKKSMLFFDFSCFSFLSWLCFNLGFIYLFFLFILFRRSFPHTERIDSALAPPIYFSGDLVISSELIDGISKDFNVFVDRNLLKSKVSYLKDQKKGAEALIETKAAVFMAYVVQGDVEALGKKVGKGALLRAELSGSNKIPIKFNENSTVIIVELESVQ